MLTRWSLRFRIFLFFALILCGGAAGIGGGLWLGYARLEDPSALSAFVVAGLVAGFALAGLVLWVWLMFDENVAKPLARLAGDMRARAHAGVDEGIEHAAARYLGDIGPAAAAVTENLVVSRSALAEAVARETQHLGHQKTLLERALRDAPAGVVICTAEHRIALYNEQAVELFGETGLLGLDRPIFGLVTEGPVRHAFERLTARPDDSRKVDLLCPTHDGHRFLTGQMRLMPSLRGDDAPPGYMLTLHDVTRELQSNFALHLTLRDSLEKIRRPTANLATVVAAMEHVDELVEDRLASLRASLRGEVDQLATAVSDVSSAQDRLLTEHWPMSDTAVGDLCDALGAQFPDAWFGIRPGDPELLLRCDSFGLVLLLAGTVRRLRDAGATAVSVDFAAEPPGARIDLWAEGLELGLAQLETWLDEPLDDEVRDITARDVLLRHATELWPEHAGAGRTCLRVALREARQPRTRTAGPRPADFYDFSLLDAESPGADDERPLTSLRFVVFDTETTGLAPNQGDEIVQIAAVRIVNRRLLSGETFDTLVNPGRPIPPRSTEVHGIDDGMVAGAPGVLEAVGRFHRFCGDAVLIAHNAPFDMAFLRRAEPQLGLRFGNTVLDTVLLSAMLYGRTEQHSLDALASRLGIAIPEAHRHTALGDSLATAQAFLRMLPLLSEQGFTTLGDTVREFRNYRSLLEAVT